MPPRVLLADDHQQMMAALARLVEPGCEIVGRIADGSDVLDAVARLRPDVLVVDVNMPGLDGIEICRRAVQDFPDVSVIVLTAAADAVLERQAHDAGAAAFIAKLSAAAELPAAIARAHRPR